MSLADVEFREATRDDLVALVTMLADDPLGAERETVADPLPSAYVDAYDAIAQDANNLLLVACTEGRVVAMLQLTFLPSLTRRGSWRGQIEGVRVAAAMRGSGIGRRLVKHAIELAAQRGCLLVQLTTDKSRADALRFYESLGFRATHEGMKLQL